MLFYLYSLALYHGIASAVTIQNADSPTKIPGSFIVVFKPGVLNAKISDHQNQINTLLENVGLEGIVKSYKLDNFKGYHVKSNKVGLELIAKSPLVSAIIQDVVVTTAAPAPASSLSSSLKKSSSTPSPAKSPSRLVLSSRTSSAPRITASSSKSSTKLGEAAVTSSRRPVSSSFSSSVSSSVSSRASSRASSSVSSSVRSSSNSASASSTCNAGMGIATQIAQSWSLPRMSHKKSVKDDSSMTYLFDRSSCAGTFAYIVDTGIYPQHPDFGGRAIFGKNFIDGSPDTDENGHGTHVAGTIGSSIYGVCKNITLIGVKVLDGKGSGSLSGVMAGAQWARDDARQRGVLGKSVINMSLGGDKYAQANDAFDAIVNDGLMVVVAAGNSNVDAANATPASASKVLAVGATDINDNLASFSNWGATVKILAPGVNIKSTWIPPYSYATISGTSMASPHVAGLAAYFMGRGTSGPTAVAKVLTSFGLKNVAPDTKGAANVLAYNNAQC